VVNNAVVFSPDQEMEILGWLEWSRDAGLTLDDLIKGMEDGTLTTVVSESKQDSDVH
jgi:hypothetical protein